MSAMTTESFWGLISDMKAECDQDMDASYSWMKERLIALGPQQAQAFHDIFHGYQDLAYCYGLWSAAALMCEHGCTDDGFIDFRSWLISQGREIYMAALADPDSLADVEPYGGCQFEELTYAGDKALNTIMGTSAYDGTAPEVYDALVEELRRDIAYGEGVRYPYEWDEIETYFPRMCARYLEPGTVEFMLKYNRTMWFADNPYIQQAREGGPPDNKKFQNEMGGM